ncbi:hypothetical protein RvY_10006 [Ramazzottius varieornatus]|uniref:DUF4139 domain-containing protein n=1 Tax=Ramazzottius varieornatus TaxID=947166 RepID=A0A1D1VBD4_RAMVA|nr:hypothetical protein RvY_10006 [Ramazzottius varieornatus]
MASIVQEFKPQEAPISRVTVYRDRAEITRGLRFQVKTVGLQDVVLASVPTPVQLDSLRVDGKGSAQIVGVNVSDSWVEKSASGELKQKEKNQRELLEGLEERKADAENAESLHVKQLQFWDQCSDSLSKEIFAVKDGKSSPVTSDTYTKLNEFLGVYLQEKSKIEKELRIIRKSITKLNEEIETAQRNLNEVTNASSRQTWSILVSLDVAAPGDMELTYSYIAHHSAWWSPKYDVRVAPESKKITLSYYGVITQNTGEDWVDVPLQLSTAVPSHGGTIPTLGTKQISFKEPPPPVQIQNPGFGYGGAEPRMKRMTAATFSAQHDTMEYAMAPMAMAVSRVQDSGVTTSFEIIRPATIPSDGSEHKVTVGIIDMESHMQYKSIPKREERAFLEAKAKNSSPYPILPGPASVFFGTNFVATVNLKTVSPQEDFTCSLGVDPAVRITYRPVRKFNEQTGLLQRSNVVTYVQEVDIYNTREESIHIVLQEQVPRSTEDRLKVILIEPALTRDQREAKGYLLNQDNNLEAEMDIKGRTKHVWTIKYRLEYPSDKEIEETELPSTI